MLPLLFSMRKTSHYYMGTFIVLYRLFRCGFSVISF